MKRTEAEERYKNKVNNTFIYDKFPVPASITELNIIEIPEWNVNCCKGPHVKNTSDLGALLILQNKFRPKKNEWEIKFITGKDALEELQSGTKKQLSQGSQKNKPQSIQSEHDTTEEKASEFDTPTTTYLSSSSPSVYPKTALDTGIEELMALLLPRMPNTTANQLSQEIAPILNRLHNSAYTSGFKVGSAGTKSPIPTKNLL